MNAGAICLIVTSSNVTVIDGEINLTTATVASVNVIVVLREFL